MPEQRAVPSTVLTVDHDRSVSLDRIYREYWGALCRFVRHQFGAGPPEPEEVAQAAFERLARSQTQKTINNPRAFLFAIATNIVRDHQRRAVFRATVHREMEHHNRDIALSGLTPESVLESRQRMAEFKAVLAKMPVVRRRVFLMLRVEGMSVTEVAEKFGMSEGAVYKHVSRAMHDCMAAMDALPGATKVKK